MDSQEVKKNTRATFTKVAFFEVVKGKMEYYFGSLRAIFTQFTEEEVGCNLDTLYQKKISKGNAYVNDKCRITKETMARVARNTQQNNSTVE